MSATRAVALGVAVFALNALAFAMQTPVYRFNGVGYVFPSSQGANGEVFGAIDSVGGTDWVSDPGASQWPADMVVFSSTGSCPDGWTEYTALRGRYVVGLPSGGTNATDVGTALTNVENRATGQHTHTLSDSGHTHTQTSHTHELSDPGHQHSGAIATTTVGVESGSGPIAARSGSTTTGIATTGISLGNTAATNQSATTGITVANAGSVTGTNAPALQLLACLSPTP